MSGQNESPYYFIPNPSQHPIAAAAGLLVMLGSLAGWINGVSLAPLTFALGLAWLLFVLWHWFGDSIGESEIGMYGKRVDTSYRWSMSWFIFSEVMFFGAFFGALFYARQFALHDLGNLDAKLIWPDFAAVWPNNGPSNLVAHFKSMQPWPIPTINTALLLTSGATLTVAHHALRDDHRNKAIVWLAATVLLGVIFLFMQGYEYFHAYNELNLKLTSGVYGSTFFLLTGFHGFHVTMGALMLAVVLVRLIRGHFKPDHHFAFEGAAWYWHFVDVVWLGLYVVVYWL
ncbi:MULTISPECIES: cytochrome c oxidase subunit 3 [Burkholderiaceae]|uniref:cytochrome c oxidase subunit 3 n=1 Tax=Burkholderiaceae TaxID=119060 RepID=UPI00096A0E30|nr:MULTISPECIES: cytochrome c oxidase subunit 3 [Burkholderiaceae]MCF2134977.1 cytochrome c oxidase subunit 3 [Mycetohabitans sp. B3]MCG1019489.1 cytochrome c oxidase subunit 3 [Mycetohabitans sp. B4]MCG1040295.1 cytochrome c oxidase subunit 3 [Mycetohabitans sp. B7]SIT71909.1 cytochrome c oxidase subunit 3 [Burkholderia sp. b13]SIT73697.1 cytochrome c oxidase subunit 3 [Burkholderia sp. b14]